MLNISADLHCSFLPIVSYVVISFMHKEIILIFFNIVFIWGEKSILYWMLVFVSFCFLFALLLQEFLLGMDF